MGIEEAYTKEILKQRGTYAAYPFGTQVSIGDFGRLDGNTFVREGKLGDQSWYEGNLASSQGSTADTISLTTSGEVKITFKAAGETTGAGTGRISLDAAGFVIDFGAKHSVILECQGVRNFALSHITHIGGQIIDRFQADKWPKDRVLVTEVWEAASTFAAVSKSSDVTLELEVEGSVRDDAQNELANGNADLKIVSSASAVESAIFNEKWKPYFVLYKIKKPIGGRTTFEKV